MYRRGREVARGVLRSCPKPEKGLFFAIGEGSRSFVACFLHSSAQVCLYQTPGRRPPRIISRFVNTVTRGWVGAPHERAPFRFHGIVVGFVVDVFRGLGISPLRINVWLSCFSGRSWPTICSGIIVVLFQVWNIFLKICAHSERYRNVMAGIFK